MDGRIEGLSGVAIAAALGLWLSPAAASLGPVEEPPAASIEALRQRLVSSYEEGDVAGALRAAEALLRYFPDNAFLAFDIGRLRHLQGDTEGAIASLQQAAELGFAQLDRLDAEPDLAPLRDRPEWARLRAAVVANQEAAWEDYVGRVAAHPPPIVAPKKVDPAVPLPLIVVLHGRGGTAAPLEELWRPEARRLGAVLVTPQGLFSAGDGYRWGSIRETEHQVLEAIRYAESRYPIDPRRILLSGFSMGGRRSIAIALANPRLFAGVIVVGSSMDRETSFPEVAGSELPPFYFMVGEEDRALPRARATSAAFERQGIANRLVVFPGVGHSFPPDHRLQLRRATRFVLGRGPR